MKKLKIGDKIHCITNRMDYTITEITQGDHGNHYKAVNNIIGAAIYFNETSIGYHIYLE